MNYSPEKKQKAGIHGETKPVYNFRDQIKDKRQDDAVKICIDILRSKGFDVEDVNDKKEYQLKDIDILFSKEGRTKSIEVKCDFKINATGNFIFEIIEIWPFDCSRNMKPGWGMITEADYIWYLDWDGSLFYVFDFKELYKFVFENEFKCYKAKHEKPFPYFTLGYLLPIKRVGGIIRARYEVDDYKEVKKKKNADSWIIQGRHPIEDEQWFKDFSCG